MPITPPTPVVRAGAWEIKAAQGDHFFDPRFPGVNLDILSCGFPDLSPVDSTATYVFPAEPFIYLDGALTPTDSLDLPLGFDPDAAYVVHHGIELAEVVTLGSFVEIKLPELGLDELLPVGTPSVAQPRHLDMATGMTILALHACAGATVTVPARAADYNTAYNVKVVDLPLTISGTYAAFSWWWQVGHPAPDAGPEGEGHRVPMVDACGNRQDEAPFLQTGEDPGPPWERLDPDDEAAHPTPVVLAVTPNHGAVAGGTPVTITGSGFGYGATATFDGVPATDVVAVTQTAITCVTPAHATGAADVVVTNTDGRHS